MIRRLIPVFRRTVQLTSLLVLVLIPLFALHTHYREARALHDLNTGNWREVVVLGIEQVVGDSEWRRRAVEQTQGTIWSARLFGVSLSDPLAGAEAILTSRSLYRPMLWSLVIPLAITILFGRVFCGWVCPMNTLLELVDRCRRLLRFAEIRERDIRFSLRNKYFVLAAVLGLVAVTGVPLIALFYPPAVLSREVHLFVFSATIGAGTYLILLISAVELFVSRRWWCRYMCPGGALYSLLGRIRVVRVIRDPDKCVHCGECVRVCQFDLQPMLVQITGMECTNCGACVRSCNDHALSFRGMLPRPGQDLIVGSRRSADSSPSTGVSVGLLVAALWLLPQFAWGHHILGLPHYSYKENYPQVPTLEYPAQTGPYDVLMTSFPGHPVPGEQTTIAFYIKDRVMGSAYALPVSLRLLKTATLGANSVVVPLTVREPTGNEHRYYVTFPDDGEYIAELSLEVEGSTEVIPFLMVAGEPTATKSVVITAAVGLVIFLFGVRAVKRKRERRRNRASKQADVEQAIGGELAVPK